MNTKSQFEIILEAVKNLKESTNFKKGDKVIVKNMKSYDSLAKSNEANGEIMWKSGKNYAVKVASGQINADPDDLSPVQDKPTSFKKGDKVLVKNMKSYDSLSKKTEEIGEVMWKSGKNYAVKVGSGQINADPDDLTLAESADSRNKMMDLTNEFKELKKGIDDILAKYGVKKGQMILVPQLNALKEKMSPADRKKYEDLSEKVKKNLSATARLANEPKPKESYPLGGRDEKSGRSYSS